MDGRFVLAAGARGEATRAGRDAELSRWNLSNRADRIPVTVGRRLDEPTSICDVLLRERQGGGGWCASRRHRRGL